MVDTGTSISLLHADIWGRLTADCNLVLEAWHRKLIVVEGSPLSVLTWELAWGALLCKVTF